MREDSFLRRGITAASLKWIALLSMLIDHTMKVLYSDLIRLFGVDTLPERIAWETVLGAGRMAMVLYMWMAGEGCRYTKSPRKYVLRLAAFGIISEIPFQLMVRIVRGAPIELSLGLTNVMFTLALGVCAGLAYRRFGMGPVGIGIPLLCVVAAELLGTDYGGFGVAGVFLCAVVERKNLRLLLFGALVFYHSTSPLIALLGNSPNLLRVYTQGIRLVFLLAAVLLLALYNGKRGAQLNPYLFYAFYPVHIALLAGIYFLLHR